MNELFIQALKNKFRFTFQGTISTEDLFDLNLRDLDYIYRNLNRQIKTADEETLLVNKKTAEEKLLEDKIKIVKHVFDIKNAELEAKAQEKEKRIYKARIMELINNKKEEALKEKSIEELEKLLLDK